MAFARIHSLDGMPMFTAGRAGGKVKTGLHIDGDGTPGAALGYTTMKVDGRRHPVVGHQEQPDRARTSAKSWSDPLSRMRQVARPDGRSSTATLAGLVCRRRTAKTGSSPRTTCTCRCRPASRSSRPSSKGRCSPMPRATRSTAGRVRRTAQRQRRRPEGQAHLRRSQVHRDRRADEPVSGRLQLPELETRPSCTQVWPPVLAAADAKPVGKWTIITRTDGRKQWAYDGYALYTSILDQRPGDVIGGTQRPAAGPRPARCASRWGRRPTCRRGSRCTVATGRLLIIDCHRYSVYYLGQRRPDKSNCDTDCLHGMDAGAGARIGAAARRLDDRRALARREAVGIPQEAALHLRARRDGPAASRAAMCPAGTTSTPSSRRRRRRASPCRTPLGPGARRRQGQDDLHLQLRRRRRRSARLRPSRHRRPTASPCAAAAIRSGA